MERRPAAAAGSRPATLETVSSLLVVEDDGPTARLIERILTAQGYAVTVVRDCAGARSEIGGGRYDLVITDLWLDGDFCGARFATELRDEQSGRLPVLILTGATAEETASIAGSDTGIAVLRKPFHIDDFTAAVRRLIRA